LADVEDGDRSVSSTATEEAAELELVLEVHDDDETVRRAGKSLGKVEERVIVNDSEGCFE
jgi:hypothetical protein